MKNSKKDIKAVKDEIIDEYGDFMFTYYATGFSMDIVIKSILEYNKNNKKFKNKIKEFSEENIQNISTNIKYYYSILGKLKKNKKDIFIDYIGTVFKIGDHTVSGIINEKSLESLFLKNCLKNKNINRKKSIGIIIAPLIRDTVRKHKDINSNNLLIKKIIEEDKKLLKKLNLINNEDKNKSIYELKKVLTYFPCLEIIFKNRKIEK